MSLVVRVSLYACPAVVLGVLLVLYGKLVQSGDEPSAGIVKVLCGLTPVVFCLNGCLVNEYIGFWWLCAAITVCAAGDSLSARFPRAAFLLLAAAQGLFIRTFTVFAAPPLTTAVITALVTMAAVSGTMFFLLRRRWNTMGRRVWMVIPYAVLLSVTLSLALLLPFTVGTALLSVGSLLLLIAQLGLAVSLAEKPESEAKKTDALPHGESLRLLVQNAALYGLALAVWL